MLRLPNRHARWITIVFPIHGAVIIRRQTVEIELLSWVIVVNVVRSGKIIAPFYPTEPPSHGFWAASLIWASRAASEKAGLDK